MLWTANTERFSTVAAGVNQTADELLASVQQSHPEIAPSTLYAMAAVLEGCAFINGSPQNTAVPGLLELAQRHRVFLAGDDFKSGQTKVAPCGIYAARVRPTCQMGLDPGPLPWLPADEECPC